MVDTFDNEEKKRKKWVDGEEIENNSDKLFVQYEVGSIFGVGKLAKMGANLAGGVTAFGQGLVDIATNLVTFGHGTDLLGSGGSTGVEAELGSFHARHPSVAGVYFSEFNTVDDRGGSAGSAMTQLGSYIYPFFYGHGKDDKDASGTKLRISQREKKFEVDTHNLPAHYLYTHCYYNFRIYGEDFCKMYGVEKMVRSNVYGFE